MKTAIYDSDEKIERLIDSLRESVEMERRLNEEISILLSESEDQLRTGYLCETDSILTAW